MNAHNTEVPDTNYVKIDRYSEKKAYVNKDRMKVEGLKVKKPSYDRAKEHKKWKHTNEH